MQNQELRQWYKKWFFICATVLVTTLVVFFIFFFIRYPHLQRESLEARLTFIEKQLEEKKVFPKDVDYEMAIETVRRMREMMDSGKLSYRDFSELRILNQIPLHRHPLGREYNQLFQEMKILMDSKESAAS